MKIILITLCVVLGTLGCSKDITRNNYTLPDSEDPVKVEVPGTQDKDLRISTTLITRVEGGKMANGFTTREYFSDDENYPVDMIIDRVSGEILLKQHRKLSALSVKKLKEIGKIKNVEEIAEAVNKRHDHTWFSEFPLNSINATYAAFLCQSQSYFGRLPTAQEIRDNFDRIDFGPSQMVTGEYVSGENEEAYLDYKTMQVMKAPKFDLPVNFNTIGVRCVVVAP